MTQLNPGDLQNITAWLDHIGEHDEAERAAVFKKCGDPRIAQLVAGIAVAALLESGHVQAPPAGVQGTSDVLRRGCVTRPRIAPAPATGRGERLRREAACPS